MQVVLPEITAPAKVILDPSQAMGDDDYQAFCAANPDLRIERTPQGEILIVPPAGGESDYRTTQILVQLAQWAKQDGRGKVFGPSVEFLLPTGAAYSPDASWVSTARLERLTREQRRKFPPLAPEFVIEVISPSDRLKSAKDKMDAWMAAGVELGWLIDGDDETVYVYRAGQAQPEVTKGIKTLAAEGPVAGFDLDLTDVWAGL